MIKSNKLSKAKPNLVCPSCTYAVQSDCLHPFGYCEPAVCQKCNSIYDVNTEFCGEPEEINKCDHCGEYDYKDWDQKKRPCPKCGEKMVLQGEVNPLSANTLNEES